MGTHNVKQHRLSFNDAGKRNRADQDDEASYADDHMRSRT